MEHHVMTVMCVISRAPYTTRHCKRRYLLYLIRINCAHDQNRRLLVLVIMVISYYTR